MKIQNNKIVVGSVIAFAIIAIAVAVALYVTKKKKKSTTIVDGISLEEIKDETLSYGSRGDGVKALQAWLNAKLTFYSFEKGGRPKYNGKELSSLSVDGIFGDKTLCVTKWWFGKETVKTTELV